MLPYFTRSFGNAASRTHSYGWEAGAAVGLAREQVAGLIGATAREIVFTSGATEAANLALKGVAAAYASKGNHIITAATEHKAVLDTCAHLQKSGVDVTYLGVDNKGQVNLQELEAAIRPGTVLVALMYANNETGTILPVREISAITRRHDVLLFTDATQAAGKIPVDVEADAIDLLAFSAHKIYGPKGIGALYVRRRGPRVRLTAQMDGGGHERGFRSGTLNVPGIAGFGKACAICSAEREGEAARIGALRQRLESAIMALGNVYVNGDTESRLPHVSNLAFEHLDGQGLLMGLNKELALASGSACTSASMEPSYVLKAMGLPGELAHSSLRFSLGRHTTAAEVDAAIEKVSATVQELRQLYGAGMDRIFES